MSQTWLSVLIPIYNGAEYIARALKGIYDFDADGIEVIVVDDESTDATLSIIEPFLCKPNFMFHRIRHTGNWAANTNIALGESRSSYVCILHQDDLWLPGRAKVVREICSSHGVEFWFANPSIFINRNGKRVGIWKCPLTDGFAPMQEVLEKLIVQNFISMPAPVFPRETALRLGGLDPDLKYAADWDLWLKMAKVLPLYYHARPLTAFRIHSQSHTVKISAQAEDFHKQLKIVVNRHLPEILAGCRNSKQLEKIARFSINLNFALAGLIRRKSQVSGDILRQFIGLGPSGIAKYIRDSRIAERAYARIRTKTIMAP